MLLSLYPSLDYFPDRSVGSDDWNGSLGRDDQDIEEIIVIIVASEVLT